MKHRTFLKKIVAAALMTAFLCSCDKEPISTDASDKEQESAGADSSTGTSPRAVQPWVDAGTYDLPF